MIAEGQVVLFKFPYSNLTEGKLRPALVIRRLPGNYDDWLICMISSQAHQQLSNINELIKPDDVDFIQSGLKTASVIRLFRLAVVEGSFLIGKIGQIDDSRLEKIKKTICKWIVGD